MCAPKYRVSVLHRLCWYASAQQGGRQRLWFVLESIRIFNRAGKLYLSTELRRELHWWTAQFLSPVGRAVAYLKPPAGSMERRLVFDLCGVQCWRKGVGVKTSVEDHGRFEQGLWASLAEESSTLLTSDRLRKKKKKIIIIIMVFCVEFRFGNSIEM